MYKAKTNPFKNLKLDEEERNILRSFEKGEWRSVPNLAKVTRLRYYIGTQTSRMG